MLEEDGGRLFDFDKFFGQRGSVMYHVIEE